MEVGRSEGVLRDQPPWREDDEVCHCYAYSHSLGNLGCAHIGNVIAMQMKGCLKLAQKQLQQPAHDHNTAQVRPGPGHSYMACLLKASMCTDADVACCGLLPMLHLRGSRGACRRVEETAGGSEGLPARKAPQTIGDWTASQRNISMKVSYQGKVMKGCHGSAAADIYGFWDIALLPRSQCSPSA